MQDLYNCGVEKSRQIVLHDQFLLANNRFQCHPFLPREVSEYSRKMFRIMSSIFRGRGYHHIRPIVPYLRICLRINLRHSYRFALHLESKHSEERLRLRNSLLRHREMQLSSLLNGAPRSRYPEVIVVRAIVRAYYPDDRRRMIALLLEDILNSQYTETTEISHPWDLDNICQ